MGHTGTPLRVPRHVGVKMHYVQNPEVPSNFLRKLPNIFYLFGNIFLYLQTKHSIFYLQFPDSQYKNVITYILHIGKYIANNNFFIYYTLNVSKLQTE
jgi:hypothetical protein